MRCPLHGGVYSYSKTATIKLGFKTNYRLMQVKSIAECSPLSLLQYSRPSSSYHLSLRFILSMFEWPNIVRTLLYEGNNPRGTQIFSYLHRLWSYLGVQNFEFQYFLGFQKNKYFGGMNILWILFGVITKLDYTKGSFPCILGSFLNSQGP